MINLSYPKVGQTKDLKVFISFHLNNQKIRLYSGKRINSSLHPNDHPAEHRLSMANLLAAEVYSHITKGGVLKSHRRETIQSGRLSDLEYLKLALDSKLNSNYSVKYKTTLRYTYRDIVDASNGNKLCADGLSAMLNRYTNATSYNTFRRHVNALINEAVNLGMDERDLLKNKSKKAKAKLHKPFRDIGLILDEIRNFDSNLYLCCLLTYGCLLRPHREIRELCWGDFSNDLSQIHLSGHRNKSGRNRIVPVPKYIRENLHAGDLNCNVFSGHHKAYNQDYFKCLWRRFKSDSKLIDTNHTLYSFRHSGAIEIYKRTGSLVKLQKVMGHSSLNVSWTYLRGLEVAELTEDDMPKV